MYGGGSIQLNSILFVKRPLQLGGSTGLYCCSVLIIIQCFCHFKGFFTFLLFLKENNQICFFFLIATVLWLRNSLKTSDVVTAVEINPVILSAEHPIKHLGQIVLLLINYQ